MFWPGVIGVDPAQLRREFDQGQSIAESATTAGVAVESVIDAAGRDASARIDESLAQGAASPDRAAQAKAALPAWATRFVHWDKGDFQRTGVLSRGGPADRARLR